MTAIRPLACAGSLVAALLLLGCQPDPNRLVLVYPDQASFDRARMVELYIGEQTTCAELSNSSGEPLAIFEPSERKVDLGTHSPGLLAIMARVRDVDCLLFLDACVESTLDSSQSTTVRLILDQASGEGCAPDRSCAEGRCVSADAGVTDAAALDVPPGDVSSHDLWAEDSPAPDVPVEDAPRSDASLLDGPAADRHAPDAAQSDAGWQDGMPHDSGMPDATAADTAPGDAGCVSDATCQPCYACVAGGCQPTSSLRRRRALTIDNPGMFAVITATSLHFPIDTAAMVQAGLLRADGHDLRLFYAGGSDPVELDRVAESPFDSTDTDIWFALSATIPGQSSDPDYFISYGDPAAGPPPADRHNIYLFFEDFEGDLSRWSSDPVFQLSTQQAYSGTQSLRVNAVAVEPHAIWVEGIDEGNVMVEAMFRSTTPEIDVSLATRVQANGDSYQFNIEESDQWTIGRMLDEVWESLQSTTAARPADAWYRLTAIQGGPWLSGWVDRVQRVPASGSTFVGNDLPSGSVGLATYNVDVGDHGWFDDFKVWRWVYPEPVVSVGAETEWCP